jgi:ABC-2 type transport system permease protein
MSPKTYASLPPTFSIDKIINMFDDGPDKIGVAAPNEQIYKVFKQQANDFDSP